MDVKWQKRVIQLSLDQANLAESEDLTKLFLNQAKRMQVELDQFLKTEGEKNKCSNAKVAKPIPSQEKVKPKSSPKPAKKSTQTKSDSKKVLKSKRAPDLKS